MGGMWRTSAKGQTWFRIIFRLWQQGMITCQLGFWCLRICIYIQTGVCNPSWYFSGPVEVVGTHLEDVPRTQAGSCVWPREVGILLPICPIFAGKAVIFLRGIGERIWEYHCFSNRLLFVCDRFIVLYVAYQTGCLGSVGMHSTLNISMRCVWRHVRCICRVYWKPILDHIWKFLTEGFLRCKYIYLHAEGNNK